MQIILHNHTGTKVFHALLEKQIQYNCYKLQNFCKFAQNSIVSLISQKFDHFIDELLQELNIKLYQRKFTTAFDTPLVLAGCTVKYILEYLDNKTLVNTGKTCFELFNYW